MKKYNYYAFTADGEMQEIEEKEYALMWSFYNYYYDIKNWECPDCKEHGRKIEYISININNHDEIVLAKETKEIEEEEGTDQQLGKYEEEVMNKRGYYNEEGKYIKYNEPD